MQAQVIADSLASADSLLERWQKGESPPRAITYYRARLAAERGDIARAHVIVDSVTKHDPSFRSVDADLYLREGRLQRALPLLDPMIAAIADAVLRGDPQGSRRKLDLFRANTPWDSLPEGDRPYAWLAVGYAIAGQPLVADSLLAQQARELPIEALRRDRDRAAAAALIASARGQDSVALAGFRNASRLFRCNLCTKFWEGQSFEKLGQHDSAIVHYEKFVNGHNTDEENREIYLAAALKRLGEMYESKGERTKAREYYLRLADLWKNADSEFQSVVTEMRRRAASLAGEAPRK